MLAALNVGSVAIGVAAGSLAASVVGVVASWALTLAGVDDGSGIGLMLGVGSGLFAGGWTAGSRSRHSHRFHGSVTGLLMAFVIVFIALVGGSPAPTITVVIIAGISIIVSGLAGWLAGRRRPVSPG